MGWFTHSEQWGPKEARRAKENKAYDREHKHQAKKLRRKQRKRGIFWA